MILSTLALAWWEKIRPAHLRGSFLRGSILKMVLAGFSLKEPNLSVFVCIDSPMMLEHLTCRKSMGASFFPALKVHCFNKIDTIFTKTRTGKYEKKPCSLPKGLQTLGHAKNLQNHPWPLSSKSHQLAS